LLKQYQYYTQKNSNLTSHNMATSLHSAHCVVEFIECKNLPLSLTDLCSVVSFATLIHQPLSHISHSTACELITPHNKQLWCKLRFDLQLAHHCINNQPLINESHTDCQTEWHHSTSSRYFSTWHLVLLWKPNLKTFQGLWLFKGPSMWYKTVCSNTVQISTSHMNLIRH